MQVEAHEAMREALHLKLRGVGLWLASLRGVAPRVQKEALTTILLCADELTFQSEQRAALSLNPPLSLDAGEEPRKLWLWKNFVDGRPEYWAFDNPFPVQLDGGDPQTLGEPCGYALQKESRNGRPDVGEAEVLRRIAATRPQPSIDKPAVPAESLARFGHHPDPAIDFCVEVEAIEAEISDRAAGLAPTMDLPKRIEAALAFRVGGDKTAIQAKATLRSINKPAEPSA